MVGIQIVSHGLFSKGIVDSLEMILGSTDGVMYDTLNREADLETFRSEILETTKKLEETSEKGVIVFVDMFGATPYNAALYNSQFYNEDNYAVVAGFNLPILIETIVNRETMDVKELVTHIENISNETVVVADLLN